MLLLVTAFRYDLRETEIRKAAPEQSYLPRFTELRSTVRHARSLLYRCRLVRCSTSHLNTVKPFCALKVMLRRWRIPALGTLYMYVRLNSTNRQFHDPRTSRRTYVNHQAPNNNDESLCERELCCYGLLGRTRGSSEYKEKLTDVGYSLRSNLIWLIIRIDRLNSYLYMYIITYNGHYYYYHLIAPSRYILFPGSNYGSLVHIQHF